MAVVGSRVLGDEVERGSRELLPHPRVRRKRRRRPAATGGAEQRSPRKASTRHLEKATTRILLPHRKTPSLPPYVTSPGETLCERHQGREWRRQAALTASLPSRHDARKSPRCSAENRAWNNVCQQVGSGAAAYRSLREIRARMYPTLSVPATEMLEGITMGARERGPASIAEAFVRNAGGRPRSSACDSREKRSPTAGCANVQSASVPASHVGAYALASVSPSFSATTRISWRPTWGRTWPAASSSP